MHLHDRGRHPPDSRAVALDAQPLANTTARGMSVRQGRYALAVLAMATAAFGAPLDLSLDAYRVAAADGRCAEGSGGHGRGRPAQQPGRTPGRHRSHACTLVANAAR